MNMFIKALAGSLLIIAPLFAQVSSLEQEYNGFSSKQKGVMLTSYKLGKPFNLGHTLAAIAWQESQAGEYMVNLQDPSAGVFHNNLNSVMGRHPELEDTNWQRNRMAQRLIDDIEFSAAESLAELEYWFSIHGKTKWTSVWTSYNGGFSYKRPESKAFAAASRYAKRLSAKVRFLINKEIFEKK